jgi:hypothetical protein
MHASLGCALLLFAAALVSSSASRSSGWLIAGFTVRPYCSMMARMSSTFWFESEATSSPRTRMLLSSVNLTMITPVASAGTVSCSEGSFGRG